LTWFASVIVIRGLGSLVRGTLAADKIKYYALDTFGAAMLVLGLSVVFICMHSRGAILSTIISYGLLLLFGGEVYATFSRSGGPEVGGSGASHASQVECLWLIILGASVRANGLGHWLWPCSGGPTGR
jgi:hypothetical protein